MSNTGDFNPDFSDDFLTTQGIGLPANPPAPRIRQAFRVPGLDTPIGIDTPVGVASTPLIGPDPMRRGIGFSNATANPMYVRPDNAPAQAGYGILVPPGDYVVFQNTDDELIEHTCGWNGINPSGVGGLTIMVFT